MEVAGGAVEVGARTEAEDAAVFRDEPVALSVGCGGHADDGLVEVDVAGRAVERCVEREHAAVSGDEPVATGRGIGAMPTIGWLRWVLPVEPKYGAPKVKMPPSVATSRYP